MHLIYLQSCNHLWSPKARRDPVTCANLVSARRWFAWNWHLPALSEVLFDTQVPIKRWKWKRKQMIEMNWNLPFNISALIGELIIIAVESHRCSTFIVALLCSFDCQHFGVAEPQFSVAEELKVDIGEHEAMWGLYEEFSNGLDELAKEDWISFRWNRESNFFSFFFSQVNGKWYHFVKPWSNWLWLFSSWRGHLYRFDDFLTAWSDKLRSKEPTSMTVRLQHDVDKYKVPLWRFSKDSHAGASA